MEIHNLNLDYYSDFIGEDEIRFYANSKDIVFKKNSLPNPNGGFTEFQIRQGENGICFFSLWAGYFSPLLYKLLQCSDYDNLPLFIKNWNEGLGWSGNENFEKIADDELDWLLLKLPEITSGIEQNIENSDWNLNCMNDLLLFLAFIKENNLELRIASE
nr:hypothetical protein [uncultured Flavobacterium sp.]